MSIDVTQKSFSFKIDDYEVDHQGGAILDIGVTLNYRKTAGDKNPQDYLEFQQIINYIDNYLTTYPNETDYWEILNKNMSTSLMTDNIPTIWGIDYQLSNAVKNITVDIHVQPGSGDVAFSRSSRVSVSSNSADPADETDDQNSSNLTTLLGTLAEGGRIKALKNNRFKLALTGLDHIEWLTENQSLKNHQWNTKKITKQWNNIFSEDTFALASFKEDKGRRIVFFEIAATRPGKRSESLIMNIHGLRSADHDLLTRLNQKEINDISLTIGDSIPTTKDPPESYTDTDTDTDVDVDVDVDVESYARKRSLFNNNNNSMTTFEQDDSQLIESNDLIPLRDCLI